MPIGDMAPFESVNPLPAPFRIYPWVYGSDFLLNQPEAIKVARILRTVCIHAEWDDEEYVMSACGVVSAVNAENLQSPWPVADCVLGIKVSPYHRLGSNSDAHSGVDPLKTEWRSYDGVVQQPRDTWSVDDDFMAKEYTTWISGRFRNISGWIKKYNAAIGGFSTQWGDDTSTRRVAGGIVVVECIGRDSEQWKVHAMTDEQIPVLSQRYTNMYGICKAHFPNATSDDYALGTAVAGEGWDTQRHHPLIGEPFDAWSAVLYNMQREEQQLRQMDATIELRAVSANVNSMKIFSPEKLPITPWYSPNCTKYPTWTPGKAYPEQLDWLYGQRMQQNKELIHRCWVYPGPDNNIAPEWAASTAMICQGYNDAELELTD